jgi:hypothetical protein
MLGLISSSCGQPEAEREPMSAAPDPSVSVAPSVTPIPGGEIIPESGVLECTAAGELVVQFGSAEEDFGRAIALDASGNLIVAGETEGALSGTSLGNSDAFVKKLDPLGAELWGRQFGTSNFEHVRGVTVDASGNIYVVGFGSDLTPGAALGGTEGFVRKLDTMGTEVWTHQVISEESDQVDAMTLNADGSAYLTGRTLGALEGTNLGLHDGYLRKVNASGEEEWTRQFGTSDHDIVEAIALDGMGRVLVAGRTRGALGAPAVGDYDGFIVAFDGTGNQIWAHQFGTDRVEEVTGVTVDGRGFVYVAGHTDGSFGGESTNERDAFVHAVDASGATRWTVQFGSNRDDQAAGIAFVSGELYVTGRADGALYGEEAGEGDPFVAVFGTDGALVSGVQGGTPDADYVDDLAIAGCGQAYVVGSTFGSLTGANAGERDVFVLLMNP